MHLNAPVLFSIVQVGEGTDCVGGEEKGINATEGGDDGGGGGDAPTVGVGEAETAAVEHGVVEVSVVEK